MGHVLWWGCAVVVACAMLAARKPLRAWLPPDPYLDDLYHWCVGHVAHFLAGAAVCLGSALVAYGLMGEYPRRVEIAAMALALFLVWEIGVQGWQPHDTVHDLAALLYGAAAGVGSSREAEAGLLGLTVDPVPVVAALVALAVHLAVGAVPRWRRQRGR